MRIIKRLLRWISCKVGNHYYSPALLHFTLVDLNYDVGTYRIETSCVFCGKPYNTIVSFPIMRHTTQKGEAHAEN